MTTLGFKAVSRIDAASLVIDLASELGDFFTARSVCRAGLKLNRIGYGAASCLALEWEKKYSKFK